MPDRFLDEEVFKKLSLKDLNRLRPLSRRIDELATIWNQKAYYDFPPDIKIEIINHKKENEEQIKQFRKANLILYQKERFNFLFSMCHDHLLNFPEEIPWNITKQQYNNINSKFRKALRKFNQAQESQIRSLFANFPIYDIQIFVSESKFDNLWIFLSQFYSRALFKKNMLEYWDNYWSRRNKYFLLNILKNILTQQVLEITYQKEKNSMLKNINEFIQILENLPAIEDMHEKYNLKPFKEYCIQKGELPTYDKYKDWFDSSLPKYPALKRNEFKSLLKRNPTFSSYKNHLPNNTESFQV